MTSRPRSNSARDVEAWSRELLRHTPWKTESPTEERKREEEHRALPRERQPFMVVVFGMLDYGVLWIGPAGAEGEDPDGRARRERQAETELAWWAERVHNGMWMIGFTRQPHENDLQVRQQWDLDDLTQAIRSSYS